MTHDEWSALPSDGVIIHHRYYMCRDGTVAGICENREFMLLGIPSGTSLYGLSASSICTSCGHKITPGLGIYKDMEIARMFISGDGMW